MKAVAGEKKPNNLNFSDLISMGKDLIALLRDGSLLVLAILLIIFPSKLSSILVRAGFVEGSVAGFKWDSSLVKSDTALKEAQATITSLQNKNDEFSKILSANRTKINDPLINEKISKLVEENKKLKVSSAAVQTSVSNTIVSNSVLVEKALSSIDTQGWGVVFGGDSQLADAEYEIKTVAPMLGIPNAVVFLRQGSFRSVSLVKSYEQAKEVLLKAKSRQTDSYIVSIADWCFAPIARKGYTECSNS